MNSEFTWGDSVHVVDTAPEKYLIVGDGCICGIRSIEDNATATSFGEPVGVLLYLVEGVDGEAIEIPEHLLEPL